jgi:hypothetical protein
MRTVEKKAESTWNRVPPRSSSARVVASKIEFLERKSAHKPNAGSAARFFILKENQAKGLDFTFSGVRNAGLAIEFYLTRSTQTRFVANAKSR